MTSGSHEGYVLVTGAAGHIGRAVVGHLSASGAKLLATDIDDRGPGIVRCDLRDKDQIIQLFKTGPVATVIHLAGVLPSAFHADPLGSASVNLTASLSVSLPTIAGPWRAASSPMSCAWRSAIIVKRQSAFR